MYRDNAVFRLGGMMTVPHTVVKNDRVPIMDFCEISVAVRSGGCHDAHMVEEIAVGREVTLRSLAGPIRRVVVAFDAGIISVCRREEYDKANLERRTPISIGFKAKYLIESH